MFNSPIHSSSHPRTPTARPNAVTADRKGAPAAPPSAPLDAALRHASANRMGPALASRSAPALLDRDAKLAYYGKAVLKALADIRELPRGPGSDVLVGQPWWAVRRPLEQLLRAAASDKAAKLAIAIADGGLGKAPLARDISLSRQMERSAGALVESFQPAAPVLQELLERVKELAKHSPTDAAQYVIPNAVLVCGFAAAARTVEIRQEANSSRREVLHRLRETAHALAQNRPDFLTYALASDKQKAQLETALGSPAMVLHAELASLEKPMAGAAIDSKQSLPHFFSPPRSSDECHPPRERDFITPPRRHIELAKTPPVPGSGRTRMPLPPKPPVAQRGQVSPPHGE
jgi:hypothetical protein